MNICEDDKISFEKDLFISIVFANKEDINIIKINRIFSKLTQLFLFYVLGLYFMYLK